jgi:hypothetical protein
MSIAAKRMKIHQRCFPYGICPTSSETKSTGLKSYSPAVSVRKTIEKLLSSFDNKVIDRLRIFSAYQLFHKAFGG